MKSFNTLKQCPSLGPNRTVIRFIRTIRIFDYSNIRYVRKIGIFDFPNKPISYINRRIREEINHNKEPNEKFPGRCTIKMFLSRAEYVRVATNTNQTYANQFIPQTWVPFFSLAKGHALTCGIDGAVVQRVLFRSLRSFLGTISGESCAFFSFSRQQHYYAT